MRVSGTYGSKYQTGLHGLKVVRKTKMQMVATHRRVIALWHVQQLT